MVPPPEVLKEKNFKYGNKCQKRIFNNFGCFWIDKILQKNSWWKNDITWTIELNIDPTNGFQMTFH